MGDLQASCTVCRARSTQFRLVTRRKHLCECTQSRWPPARRARSASIFLDIKLCRESRPSPVGLFPADVISCRGPRVIAISAPLPLPLGSGHRSYLATRVSFEESILLLVLNLAAPTIVHTHILSRCRLRDRSFASKRPCGTTRDTFHARG